MKVGTVFFWDKLIQYKGKWKGRWFIYLGKTAFGVAPARAHMGTTTTQLLHYAEGGYRARNRIMRFREAEFGFSEPCVLDVDHDIQSADLARLESSKEIAIKGCLDDNALQRLYELLRPSGGVDRVVKQEIYFCFRDAGIRVKRP